MSAENDKAKFQVVVEPYLSDAFSLARWISGNRTDAEDILQDACLRAYRGIGGYAGGSARAWVLTIVRRAAYSWIGKNRASSVVAFESLNARERVEAELGGAVGLPIATPEAELIAKADGARLEAAIAALPLEFRETLVLRDVQGLDYREIAEVMAIPVGTVMSRLARARRRLMLSLGTGQS